MATPAVNNVLRYSEDLLPVLDRSGLKTPAAAYSLRKLKSSATKAIRVRRSSDNAEIDIGFCSNNLCVATLKSFVGSDSAYVTTWYDQSGYGNNATQTTAGNQPRIVNSGIIDRDFDTTKANAMWPSFASASGNTIVSNGDFSNGTTGWTIENASSSVSNNTLTITNNGSAAYGRLYRDAAITSVVGKRIYARLKVRVTNNSCNQIRIDIDGSTAGTNQPYDVTSPVANQWYTVSYIATQPSDVSGNVRIKIDHNYADAATANGKVMEVQEVVAIDVTELGMPAIQTILASDTHFSVANSPSLQFTTNATLALVHYPNSYGESNFGYILSKNGSTDYRVSLSSTSTNAIIGFGPGYESNANAFTMQNQNINTITHNSTLNQTSFYYNGNLNRTTTATARSTSTNNLYLFNVSTTDRQYDGKISELILFGTTLSDSQRRNLEKSQGKYYSISVGG